MMELWWDAFQEKGTENKLAYLQKTEPVEGPQEGRNVLPVDIEAS